IHIEVSHFLWLAALDKLLKNAQRVKSNLSNDATCLLCSDKNKGRGSHPPRLQESRIERCDM
ncbi:hypothetical protein LINPERHAP2_LOCUS30025, partial [Linum perenne]